jgi:ankyrin repeat protein
MFESLLSPADQHELIKKMNLYQFFHGRPQFLSKEGFCNALTAIFILRGEEYLRELTNPILNCDNSCIMLQGEKIQTLMNEIVGLQNLHQHISGHRQSNIPETISFLTHKKDKWLELNDHFNLSFVFNPEQLSKTLSDLRTNNIIAEDRHITIGGLEHVVGATYKNGKYIFYDSNEDEFNEKKTTTIEFDNEKALVIHLMKKVFGKRLNNKNLSTLPVTIQVFSVEQKYEKVDSQMNEVDMQIVLDNTNKQVKIDILSSLTSEWQDIDDDTKFEQNCIGRDGCTPLHMAIIDSDKEFINYFFANFKDTLVSEWMVSHQDKDGQSPLFLAILTKQFDIFVDLVCNGATLILSDKKGFNLLHYMVAGLNYDEIELLFEALGNNNEYFLNNKSQLLNNYFSSVNGDSPLMFAIREKKLEVVQLFLKSGANQNLANKAGVTPCMLAARLQSTKILETLISQGVDLSEKDKDSKTALHYAAKYKSIDAFLIIAKDDLSLLDEKDNKGQTPLDILLNGLSHEEVQSLLDKASFNTYLFKLIDNQYENIKNIEVPLRETLQSGGFTAISDILKIAPSENTIIEKVKVTALHEAIQNGNYALVELLLLNGIKPDLTIIEGKSALYAAIECGQDDIAILLLQHGANPNLCGNHQITKENSINYLPLFIAFQQNNIKLLQALLEAGADPTVRIKYDNDWISINPADNWYEYLPIALQDKCSVDLINFWNIDDLLPIVKNSTNIKYICDALVGDCQLFLNMDKSDLSKLNFKTLNGSNLLHILVRQNHKFATSALGLLIESGSFDVNQTDFDGNTPLHIAVLENHPSAVRTIMFCSKPTLTIRNNEGLTAYEYAELENSIKMLIVFKEKASPRINQESESNQQTTKQQKLIICFENDPHDQYTGHSYQTYSSKSKTGKQPKSSTEPKGDDNQESHQKSSEPDEQTHPDDSQNKSEIITSPRNNPFH